jgi:hypothetical protein
MGEAPLIQINVDLTKPVTKLVETVARGIGVLYEPVRIVREAKAQAEAVEIKAEADAKALVIHTKSEIKVRELAVRAGERIAFRELRRQENIERITAKALPLLPNEVAEQAVDPDWTAHFFDNCQDISDEQMQQLWARLLAGEVAVPGTFSLGTLALVRIMNKGDADLFTRLCSLVWEFSREPTCVIPDRHGLHALSGVHLKFGNLLHLDDLGLIRFTPNFAYRIELGHAPTTVAYYGKFHHLSMPGDNQSAQRAVTLGEVVLTEAGMQLAGIAGAQPSEEHRQAAVAMFRQQGWHVEET